MKKTNQSGFGHLLLIVLLVIVGLVIAGAYTAVSRSNSKSKPPFLVNDTFDTSVYNRQIGANIVSEDVIWNTRADKVDKPGNIFEAGGAEYDYYLIGSSKEPGAKYYFADQKPFQFSETGQDFIDQVAAFTTNQIVFKINSDGKTIVLSRMSPSLANYEDLDYENIGGKDKSGTFSSLAKEKLGLLTLASGVKRDDTTLVSSSAAPTELQLDNGIRLMYRGFSYGPGALVAQPIGSITGSESRKVQAFKEGVLYELTSTDQTYKEKSVKYLLVLNNHTKALYQIRNDFNHPPIDEITWQGGEKNEAQYIIEANRSQCKQDRQTMTHTIVSGIHNSELMQIGKYPDGEPLFALSSSSSYTKERYKTYEKLRKLSMFKNVVQANNIDEYTAKRPFYLVDSRQGYYYVYSNPAFIYGASGSCESEGKDY